MCVGHHRGAFQPLRDRLIQSQRTALIRARHVGERDRWWLHARREFTITGTSNSMATGALAGIQRNGISHAGWFGRQRHDVIGCQQLIRQRMRCTGHLGRRSLILYQFGNVLGCTQQFCRLLGTWQACNPHLHGGGKLLHLDVLPGIHNLPALNCLAVIHRDVVKQLPSLAHIRFCRGRTERQRRHENQKSKRQAAQMHDGLHATPENI